MSEAAARILEHLETLVGFDSQNPPRNLDGGSAMFAWLRATLGAGFDIDITDHGKGRVSFFATRGAPDLLFNVHLDTVPVLPGARFPALELTRHEDRVYGRGACDIKGAAACLLALAETTEAPLALLFTTDEEGGEGCCVAEFIAAGRASGYRQVVVAEPTLCRAETRHRGFLSARGWFSGIGGHSSEPRALADSAVHRLADWSVAALAEARKEAGKGNRSCFNIGTVEGGVKSNIIADSARVFWSARLQPGDSNEAFFQRCTGLADPEHVRWEASFSGPPLPTAGQDETAASEFATANGLEPGQGLDFWTEASLFGAAGIPALVLGPGDIEQAHVVDEWVSIEQLEKAFGCYARLVTAHD
jgi:acetylornithine deacetylase